MTKDEKFLAEFVPTLRGHGPNRVIVGEGQEAVGSLRAQKRGFHPDIIFVRDDSWTLGATFQYEQDAYNTWPDTWIGFTYTDRADVPEEWKYHPFNIDDYNEHLIKGRR